MFGEEAIQLKAETSGWIIFRYEKKFEMQKKMRENYKWQNRTTNTVTLWSQQIYMFEH